MKLQYFFVNCPKIQLSVTAASQNKKDLSHRLNPFSYVSLSTFFDVENLFTAIVAAYVAYAVIFNHLVTCGVGALCITGHCKLAVVGSSLVSTCAGHFSLRYCHVETSSLICAFGASHNT